MTNYNSLTLKVAPLIGSDMAALLVVVGSLVFWIIGGMVVFARVAIGVEIVVIGVVVVAEVVEGKTVMVGATVVGARVVEVVGMVGEGISGVVAEGQS